MSLGDEHKDYIDYIRKLEKAKRATQTKIPSGSQEAARRIQKYRDEANTVYGILLGRNKQRPPVANLNALNDAIEEVTGEKPIAFVPAEQQQKAIEQKDKKPRLPTPEETGKSSKQALKEIARKIGGTGATSIAFAALFEPKELVARPIETLLGTTETAKATFGEIEEGKLMRAAELEQLIPTDKEGVGARQAAKRESQRRAREKRLAPYMQDAFLNQ